MPTPPAKISSRTAFLSGFSWFYQRRSSSGPGGRGPKAIGNGCHRRGSVFNRVDIAGIAGSLLALLSRQFKQEIKFIRTSDESGDFLHGTNSPGAWGIPKIIPRSSKKEERALINNASWEKIFLFYVFKEGGEGSVQGLGDFISYG